MCTIFHRVIIKGPVMIRVHAFKRKTFVRNSVIVAAIVRIDFQVVGARHNVTQSNVHAIWLCANVIQISVKRVVRINSI